MNTLTQFRQSHHLQYIFLQYFTSLITEIVNILQQLSKKKTINMQNIHSEIKQGNVYTYQVPQSSASYVVRMAITAKGLWICISESFLQWKLTISEELASQTIAKATSDKQIISFKQFIAAVVTALKKEGERWSIGIMTPVELEMLRGGSVNKQSNNSKLYLILSDKSRKIHLPFTLILQQLNQKQKIIEAIKTFKDQLDDLRANNDKSQTSFSILSESALIGDQLKLENQELKKKIRIYQESLTQKRGAVEMDNILRQKNNLELLAQTKKRQEHKQITRLKNAYGLMDREINQLRTEVDHINRELLLLQDSMGNPAKLKSHAMRVLKSYENDLRTSKKVLMKQTKDIETLKRNILSSKNTEKKNLAKIKQIEAEIQQAKKKANIKQISNRLHSPNGSKNGGSSNAGSLKAPSVASDESDIKRRFGNKVQTNNLVRQNLLNRTSNKQDSKSRERSLSNKGPNNQLLKTAPNIKTPSIPRKTEYKVPARPVVSSHTMNNQNTAQQRQRSKDGDWNSAKSSSAQIKRKQFSPAERDRQKQAIDRLTGNRNQSGPKPPIGNSSSNKNIGKVVVNKSSSVAKKDNAKDILNRMKQVKAQYNSRSKNSAAKEQGVAAKVAELTSKKQIQ